MKSATILSQNFTNKFHLTLLVGLTFLSTLLKAQTPDTLWSEKWERTNWTNDWHVDAGTWEVGKPTSGPGKAYRGENCAATVLGGNYSEPVDSRLIRHTSFVVPSAAQNPRLRFWHWYSFHNGDNGEVQIKVGTGTWQPISESYTYSSSGIWSYPSIDLRSYAGMTVQIAFNFHSQCSDCFRGDVAPGWYIDDVALITGAIVFNNPEGWEAGLGDWYVDKGTWEIGTPTAGPPKAFNGQKCAGTVLAGNYFEPVDSRLISPQIVVPNAAQNPRLRFWHWYSFHNGDNGVVQIKVGNGNWQNISEIYTYSSSGIWSYPSLDLRPYAGMTVQIAFNFHSQCSDCFRGDVATGWYIDDVALITGAIVFNNPEGWEAGLGDWYVDKGTWEIGTPTAGPPKAFNGQKCAGTVLAGNYFEPVDSRLISPQIVVPSVAQNPRLRFWHWYSFHNGDNGVVQIKVGNGNWQNISEIYTYSSSGIWSYPSLDLRSYAGMTVQIAFNFHSQCSDCFRGDVATGWYIDDVTIITGAIVFNNPEGWESGLGDWYVERGTWEIGTPPSGAHSGQKCASTVSTGNYFEPVATRLISPKFVVAKTNTNPSLRFWHRYNFHNGDLGLVQIRVDKGPWTTILGPYTGTSSGIWTPLFKDLSSYADSTVQIAFYFESQCSDCFRGDVSDGWDIDDIQIDPIQVCNYSISPNSQSFPPSGGTGSVNVTAIAGCQWTAVSNVSWIKITSGNTGNGNGTVNYSVDPNTDTNNRTGTMTIAGQTFTVNQEGMTSTRSVRIVDAAASVGGTVSVSLELVAQGNENALGFSLTFDPAILSNPQAAKGSDASSATLNTNSNQSNLGRFGITLALPAGQTFTAGTRQIVAVTFTVNASTTATMTTIDFGDQPIVREVVDASANILSTTWTPGKVTITRGYDADVAPRPNGDGRVTTADWVQVGRFTAALDVARTDVNEFQRADCAPKPCGDGRITTADWVQAGRYAAGLDPVVPACGPTSPTPSLAAGGNTDGSGAAVLVKSAYARTVRVPDIKLVREQKKFSLPVELDAQGDENALGFSLNFDPVLLQLDTVTVGNGATGAALNVNAIQKNSGRVGMALALQTGAKFGTGIRQVVVVTFSVKISPLMSKTTVDFGDLPVAREVVDINANSLSTLWMPSLVTSVQVKANVEEIPQSFELGQNYPNPFNPSTNIEFALPRQSHVILRVFNLTGQEIATLVDQQLPVGRYKAQWDANGVESGIYFYQLRAGEFSETKRLVLMR